MKLTEFMPDDDVLELEKRWIKDMKLQQMGGSGIHNPLIFLEVRVDNLNRSLQKKMDALDYINLVKAVSEELIDRSQPTINEKDVEWERFE